MMKLIAFKLDIFLYNLLKRFWPPCHVLEFIRLVNVFLFAKSWKYFKNLYHKMHVDVLENLMIGQYGRPHSDFVVTELI